MRANALSLEPIQAEVGSGAASWSLLKVIEEQNGARSIQVHDY